MVSKIFSLQSSGILIQTFYSKKALLIPYLVKSDFNPQLNSSFSSIAHQPLNSKDSSFISPLTNPPANYKAGGVLAPNVLPLRNGFTGISFTKEFENLLQYIAVTAGNTKLP